MQCSIALLHVETVDAPDHLVQGAEAELRHQLAHFLRDKIHEVDHELRIAAEFRAQLRVLRGHAHGTGVEMAHAHHDAAERDQRRSGKPEFLGAQQRGNDNVAAGLELAVGFDIHAAAEIVEHERLLRFRQAEFPRRARVLDARERRRARASVVTADENHIGMRFRHARGNGADADFADEFHADAGALIGVLQVVDQFREVLNRINIMVRRRRDQANPGR